MLVAFGCGRVGFGGFEGGGNNPLTDASASDDSMATGDGAIGDGAAPSNFVAVFTQLPATSAPEARRSSGAAVAPDDRIWIFGGFAGTTGDKNDVAAYPPSTGQWAAPAVTGTPPARERHVLGWDASSSVLVSFSGYSGTFPTFTHNDELFIFSPTTSAWTQIPKAGTWPAARKDAAMVWVPSLNQMLVYGGNNGSGTANRFSDLWLLSVNVGASTAAWTLLAPGGVTPPAQSAPCVGYDPVGRRLILFGGETSDGASTNTTYQYLVDTNVWQRDTPTGTVPSSRSFSQCAWDPGAGRLVLYGGQDSAGNPIAGAYAYDPDAKRWATLALGTGSGVPGNSSDGGATYSTALGGMFWFGGRTATITYSNVSWLLDLQPQ